MLMYTRRGCTYGCCVPTPQSHAALPEHVRRMVDALCEARSARAAALTRRRAELRAEVEARREHIRAVIALMPVPPGHDCRFVDSDWLQSWANATPGSGPPPINNGELACPHGHLDPGAWSIAKRVSVPAWQELHARWGGAPEFGLADLCMECMWKVLNELVARCAQHAALRRLSSCNIAAGMMHKRPPAHG
jgi:hypothetical protein